MLALNILTFTVGTVASAVSAFLGTLGVEAVIDPDANRRMRAEIDELDRRLVTADGELEDLRARNTAQVTDLNQRLTVASAELDDLRAQNVALLGDLDTAERRAASALADVGTLRSEQIALREVNDAMRGQVDTIARRISSRTAEVAAANVTATAGEAIPFYGIAIVVAATTYELWGACETMRDMRDLNLALGLATDEAEVSYVCGLRVPTREEIWRMIRSSPGAVWSRVTGALQSASDSVSGWSLPEVPMPDFDGWWAWAISWWSDEEGVPE